jgi:homoserine dehydrogenase
MRRSIETVRLFNWRMSSCATRAGYSHLERVTQDITCAFEGSVDAVVVCVDGINHARSMTRRALECGKFVITSNRGAASALGCLIGAHTGGPARQLWHSATAGGAIPVLERIAGLDIPIREIRGVLSASFGQAIHAWITGGSNRPVKEFIASAEFDSPEFCERYPMRALSGRETAEQLSFIVQAAFNTWIEPEAIPTNGIGHVKGDLRAVRLVARARRTDSGIVSSVGPERVERNEFLRAGKGADNRLEIELENGQLVRLQGGGDCPASAALSILGDLYQIARRVASNRVATRPTCSVAKAAALELTGHQAFHFETAAWHIGEAQGGVDIAGSIFHDGAADA